MRTETITKTYLFFNELTKDQQTKVIENMREDQHYFFEHEVDYILENFKELLDIIGFNDIEIFYSGFCSQGDGACFTGFFDYPQDINEVLKQVKESHLDYILEDDKDIIENFKKLPKEFYGQETESVYKIASRYQHENTVRTDNEILTEVVRDLSRLIYRELESQWDYIHSDDYIEELINCNGYEFDSETLKIA